MTLEQSSPEENKPMTMEDLDREMAGATAEHFLNNFSEALLPGGYRREIIAKLYNDQAKRSQVERSYQLVNRIDEIIAERRWGLPLDEALVKELYVALRNEGFTHQELTS